MQSLNLDWYWKTVIGLFVAFLVVNMMYLHRVPGLMGDEASEGENVYQKINVLTDEEPEFGESVLVTGERSYIGPLIDYVRIPFVWAFGYTALSLRLVVVLGSFVAFGLAAYVFRELFGEIPGLFALVFGFFSPLYLSFQRMGWAITLFVFFGFVVLYFLMSRHKHRAAMAGLFAGIGLANHILFLPTIVAVGIAFAVSKLKHWKELVLYWPAAIGFWAGFGTQFVVLQLFTDDQGDPTETTALFSERLRDFIDAFPLYLSGSSYVARYTGIEFMPAIQYLIVGVLGVLAVAGVALLWKRSAVWLWLLGLAVYLPAMMYLIDRFTLRYFFVFAFGVWVLSGVGLGAVVQKLKRGNVNVTAVSAGICTALLTLWFMLAVMVPFLRSGGDLADFSLGDRTNSASALVDTRPLVECVRGAGPVSSENVHIYNRLLYLSHEYSDIEIVDENQLASGAWRAEYRSDPIKGEIEELCPDAPFWRVSREK